MVESLGIVIIAAAIIMFGVIALPILLHDSDTGASLIDQLFDVNATTNFQDWIITFDNVTQMWITENGTQFVLDQISLAQKNHTNIGGGAEVFKNETVSITNFRTLIGGGGVTVNQLDEVIEIRTGGGGNSNKSIANIQTPNGLFQAAANADTVEFFGNGISISNTSSVFFELNATTDLLNDVSYTDLDGGDILVYNATTGNWTDTDPKRFTGATDAFFNAEEATVDDLTGVDCVNDISYTLFDQPDPSEYQRQAVEFCADGDIDDNITWLYTVPKDYDVVAPLDFKFKLYWTDEGGGGGAGTGSHIAIVTNDAESRSTAPFDMDLSSSDLELEANGGSGEGFVGMRWDNVAVPAGSTITNAEIQFHVDEVVDNSALTVTFEGHDVADSPTFTSTDGDINNRVGTTNTVNWAVPAWTSVHDEGAAQLTPDLSSIVQEIVDLGSWASGNAITMMIRSSSGSGERIAESLNGEADNAPEITISYTDGNSELPVCFEFALLALSASEVMDAPFTAFQTVCVDRSGMDNLSITEFDVSFNDHNFASEDLVFLKIVRPDDYVVDDYEGLVVVFGGALEWQD